MISVVTKRNGEKEQYDIAKIKRCIAFCCEGIDGVTSAELEGRVNVILKNGIKTEMIMENIIEGAIQLATPTSPNWVFVAGRAHAMNEHHKWAVKGKSFDKMVKDGVRKGIYTKDYSKYSDTALKTFAAMIDYSRDLELSIAAHRTAKDKYLLPGELNQHIHMLNAMRFGLATDSHPKERQLNVSDAYNLLSNREFSLATPWMGAWRTGGNIASCFIIAPDDDLGSIMDVMKRAADISKAGGGVGVYMGYLRAQGSKIKGRPNAAGSIVNWIKILNDIAVAVDQGGKRAGAIKVSLPLWHNDIDKFLDMQEESGDPRSRAFDVFPNIIVNDIFQQRQLEQGKWVTFCPYEVKNVLGIDLRGLYGDEFTKAYLEIEKAVEAGKLTICHTYDNARDLLKKAIKMWVASGLPDVTFIDRINEWNPNKNDPEGNGIIAVNLCVAPETKVLTDKGHITIHEYENQKVNVWNGTEYSEVTIVKTGVNQKLLTVNLSNGQAIDCTHYHKFYVVTDCKGTVVEKRAYELEEGDKLIKLQTPIIHGDLELDNAYANGFYSADGSGGRIYLYGEKKDLISKFDTVVATWSELPLQNGDTRLSGVANGLMYKFFVPNETHTVKSRLDWLAGLSDGDGTIARNAGSESLQIGSINREFLLQTQLMLQTLGVQSKVTMFREQGQQLMPKNDGSGEFDYYNCQNMYRLLISSSALHDLKKLGFKTNRLVIEGNKPQRNAERFIYVESVIDNERISDTYCFTEPKKHLGVFNGILTGQCTESFSNVVPDKYDHVCNLGSIVLGNIRDFGHLGRVTREAVRMLNAGIEIAEHPTEYTKAHNKRYRTIGIGIMGLHDYLAKNWLDYDDLDEIEEIAEIIQYEAVCESARLAQVYGSFEAFEHSEWYNGDMTKRYKAQSTRSKWVDWDHAQELIDKYGMCNSQLTSPAPTTSTSLYQDSSASHTPIWSPFYLDKNKSGSNAVAAKYLSENPLCYANSQIRRNQSEIIESTARIQKWTDTGVSMELVFNTDAPGFSVKSMYDAFNLAFERKLKTIYYIRSKKIVVEACVSCAG